MFLHRLLHPNPITIKVGTTTQSFVITQKAAPAPDPDEEKGTGAEIESGGGIEEG